MPPAYEVLLLNTAIPQIQAAQSGDTYVVPRAIAFSAALTLSAGTANGVPYLNASKVLTSGSALTFDGANLGIGTTSPSTKLHVQQYGAIGATIDRVGDYGVSLQLVRNGITGNAGFGLAEQNQLGFYLNSVEQMRLTSTGLGIGTSSPGYKLDVAGEIRSSSWLGRNNSSAPTADCAVYRPADNSLGFSTANTERARITSGGYFKASNDGTYDSSTGTYHEFRQTADNLGFLVSATNASFTSAALRTKVTATAAGTGFYHIDSLDSTASRIFGVRGDGNTYNTNGTFGSFSDQKLKQNIVDVGSQWDDVKAIKFRKYRLKSQVAVDAAAPELLGVIAQELEQVSPGLVDETPDRDAEGNDLGTTTKSVKTSVLLMKAAVALQEAMARIEQLEAKVAALEAN